METTQNRRLTGYQATLMMIVENNGPASVADVAGHALIDEGSARARLATLERRGYVARTYTGHSRGSLFAYEVTPAGSEALALADVPEDSDGCDLCGMVDGRHMRACIANPERKPGTRSA